MDAARRSSLTRTKLAQLGRDQWLVIASLALVALLAWGYLAIVAAAMDRGDMSLMGMPSMQGMMAMAPAPWTMTTFVLHFLMWWVMMIGMMIPSSLPTILLYSRVQHRYRGTTGHAYVASFVLGYLFAWGLFSAAATMLQWTLGSAGLLSEIGASVSSLLGAALFAAAGLYQLSPLKYACLRHCRSPAEFISAYRRPGLHGAALTGAHHGVYCVGCCWILMALLFVGGVMNLLWVAAIAVLVLLEKIAPQGHWLARGAGIAMLAVAAWFARGAGIF